VTVKISGSSRAAIKEWLSANGFGYMNNWFKRGGSKEKRDEERAALAKKWMERSENERAMFNAEAASIRQMSMME
jgi:hypothetical protein